MPDIAADRLERLTAAIFAGAGSSAEEAATVARHLISANLVGHDSHGVLNIPVYIERIRAGHIVPGAPFELLRDDATTTVVDGHWGFGYTVTNRALDITLDKARRHGTAATTILRQGHIGRLGDYTIRGAQAGMLTFLTADSGRGPKKVAPYGGREPRLGTNPISIGVPSATEAPFCLDMATSAAAAGKLKVAQARGESVPEHWLVDADGNPTGDPAAADNGGALQPLGGPEGFKGYGLSAMVEIMAGILPGLGFGVEPSGRHNDGCFLFCVKVDALRPIDAFRDEIKAFADYLNATPPARGFEQVYFPGQIEHQRMQQRLRDGIPVEDKTWQALLALAAEYEVPEDW